MYLVEYIKYNGKKVSRKVNRSALFPLLDGLDVRMCAGTIEGYKVTKIR